MMIFALLIQQSIMEPKFKIKKKTKNGNSIEFIDKNENDDYFHGPNTINNLNVSQLSHACSFFFLKDLYTIDAIYLENKVLFQFK